MVNHYSGYDIIRERKWTRTIAHVQLSSNCNDCTLGTKNAVCSEFHARSLETKIMLK